MQINLDYLRRGPFRPRCRRQLRLPTLRRHRWPTRWAAKSSPWVMTGSPRDTAIAAIHDGAVPWPDDESRLVTAGRPASAT